MFIFETHTIVWAIFRPCDGIDAEQVESSPSALHSTVVASEGGLACCQYSTPVNPHDWRLTKFLTEFELTVMVIPELCRYDCGHPVPY